MTSLNLPGSFKKLVKVVEHAPASSAGPAPAPAPAKPSEALKVAGLVVEAVDKLVDGLSPTGH